MKIAFLRMALASAVLMVCADAAWAQRNSTLEEKLEYGWDSARGDDLNPTKSATPQQCRDICIANNRCRYWNWSEPGAGGKVDVQHHNNCVLLKATTGPTRGGGFGYRYVGGAIGESTMRPAQTESAQRRNPPQPAPPAAAPQQGSCRHEVKSWSDGTRMEGVMCNGKMHGRGSYSNLTGQRYDGEWRDGVIAGQGFAHFPSGATFDGQWENGKPNGYGTYSKPGLGVFNGFWSNGCAILSGKKLSVATEHEACGF
jgi:hypothetical protein